MTAIERGKRVIRLEREALEELERRLGDEFAQAVALIAASEGRVIVAGVGKSGLVGRKIAATLTSTGTPATFLHPVESVHGDLGIVGPQDVAILLSKSGESEEVLALLEHLTRLGVKTVAITGNAKSRLARHADVALDAWVREEACPHDLAPTTSTTVALALGDALAVALLEEKGFQREDFARLHPGGALGRRLLLRVSEVMLTDNLPTLAASAGMREAVIALAEKRGIVIATGADRRVEGVFTAGGLARLIEHESEFLTFTLAEVMTQSPKVAEVDELASAVLYRMETHGIMAMPVVDDAQCLAGVVHLHDLLRSGAG